MRNLRQIITLDQMMVEAKDDFDDLSNLTHDDGKSTPVSRHDAADQAAAENEHAQKFFVHHPPSMHNVVGHYDAATPEEKSSGHSWYQDAHHMTGHIAGDTKTPMHTVAGLMGLYSPQTPWSQNMMTAAKVARTKSPLGGPNKEGVLATLNQRKNAGRMLGGAHWKDVSTGPKVRAFTHLIEHGDKGASATVEKDKVHNVVIDRHAMSVTAGQRVSDAAYKANYPNSRKKYDAFAKPYQDAAAHLSAREGYEIHPHQVQATTWLVRQRFNQAQDDKMRSTIRNSVKTNPGSQAAIAMKKWDSYREEHHPAMTGKMPGTGYAPIVAKKRAPSENDAPF